MFNDKAIEEHKYELLLAEYEHMKKMAIWLHVTCFIFGFTFAMNIFRG